MRSPFLTGKVSAARKFVSTIDETEDNPKETEEQAEIPSADVIKLAATRSETTGREIKDEIILLCKNNA